MKTYRLLINIAVAGILSGCAATVPPELANAREAYRRASVGPAPNVAPAELHKAYAALAQAEKAFKMDPKSYQARDLAYVAQRKAELAAATASITIQQQRQAQAKDDYALVQGEVVTQTKEDLTESRRAVATLEQSGDMARERLVTEQEARAAADERAAQAQAALAKLAAIREDARGLVITLSGSVLFASNETVLLPQAQARLDQVADVLLAHRGRNIMIEGHTDSQGSDSSNLALSQRRADAVRNFLVQRGCQVERIQSRGLGENHPIADNNSAEGRANNRRVEIIIERGAQP
ncbi:MAG: OmpA family protein [Myxococcota bacterium]